MFRPQRRARGDGTDPAVLLPSSTPHPALILLLHCTMQVKAAAQGQKVMALLDSHHSADHVEEEMDLYCPLVGVGSVGGKVS